MHRRVAAILGALSLLMLCGASNGDPEADRMAFQQYFKNRFPDVPMASFITGIYAIDGTLRMQWEESEEFPPYELAIAEGRRFFDTPLVNGKHLGDCFPNGGVGVADRYPYFDGARGEVMTLELAINECLAANNMKPLPPNKGMLASVEAYMTFTTRGKRIAVLIPDDPRARAAYEQGKTFYYARRGQLNMACAHCHVDHAGRRLRFERISPALGQVSHYPVFLSEWGGVGTLHRRFGQCTERVRARAFASQSIEYRNLEYFLAYMSNGLVWNGPGTRLAQR